jgi:O-antigen/teichoic acid export membrane protein
VTLLDWAIFLALSLQQLGDSKGLSVRVQAVGALAAALMLATLLGLYALEALDFRSFVWVNIGGATFTCLLLVRWLFVVNRELVWVGSLRVADYARRWWSFARPLLFVQYYLPVVAWAGIYLVQRWYGSAEQGYYGLALQWSTIGLVFTNAALSLFWREVAFHTATGDIAHAGATYEKLSGTLFFLALVLACGLSAASDTLVLLVSGPQFLPAVSVVAVMAFYPVAQTLGQLTTAALKATERTRVYALCSLGLSVPDLLLTYFLLAPPTAAVPGLGLGALGLAIKLALFGLVSVQLYDWLNRRYLGIPRLAALGRRAFALVLVGALAWLTLNLALHWLRSRGLGALPALLIASAAYALAVLGLVFWRPSIAHLTRAQLDEAARMLLRRKSQL